MHELDQKLLRTRCRNIATNFDADDFFCAEVRGRLLERLNLVDLQPKRILDLGAGTGAAATQISAIFPDAEILSIDWAQEMLEQMPVKTGAICADAHQLPLTDNSVDIIVSNLMLPTCVLPERVFAEAQRVLRHPGLFLFTSLGPDTFKQLLRAWARVDRAPHIHSFADMHNVGDALVQAGFREPVMDVEHVTVTYSNIERAIADLRAVAATNVLQDRRKGLTTPRLWQRMLAELEASKTADGRLPLSLEVVTGQAWTGSPAAGVQMHDGEASFPISRLKR
jgi:malonyl-CoA O-methyltransferase